MAAQQCSKKSRLSDLVASDNQLFFSRVHSLGNSVILCYIIHVRLSFNLEVITLTMGTAPIHTHICRVPQAIHCKLAQPDHPTHSSPSRTNDECQSRCTARDAGERAYCLGRQRHTRRGPGRSGLGDGPAIVFYPVQPTASMMLHGGNK